TKILSIKNQAKKKALSFFYLTFLGGKSNKKIRFRERAYVYKVARINNICQGVYYSFIDRVLKS
ncbi:hypothetical protein KKH96_00850, partial [Patescibacteria group bacterium]|nr:hypothetical protein [Patescibacteria group bacterium]